MPQPARGAIDCDVHVFPPSVEALLPYMDAYWREHVVTRGLDRDSMETAAYPPGAALSCRPDWRAGRKAVGDLASLQSDVLDGLGLRFAVLNCIHGGQMFYAEDLSAAFCRAINDWLAAEWLAQDPRLRASIVVPFHSPELAVREIERRAGDSRFVQVLLLVSGELPLGRRPQWPIYEAAERHGLPVGIHAGSSFRHAPTTIGWPSYYLEDYVSHSSAFAGALNSLVTEGVFVKFPQLKVVLIESGVTWLPHFIWRANLTWRAARIEVPWNKKPPADYVRDHVRMTLQPFDAPPTAGEVERVLEQIGSDAILLFSTDYPHWHFDGQDAVPENLPDRLVHRMLFDNPLETYGRLS